MRLAGDNHFGVLVPPDVFALFLRGDDHPYLARAVEVVRFEVVGAVVEDSEQAVVFQHAVFGSPLMPIVAPVGRTGTVHAVIDRLLPMAMVVHGIVSRVNVRIAGVRRIEYDR